MRKCSQCGNESFNNNICNKCGYKIETKNSFVFSAFIGKTVLICYVVAVFVLCYYFADKEVESNTFEHTNEEKCMLNCSPEGYIYNEVEDVCTCVDFHEEMNSRCKINCNSDNYYVDNDYHCICDGGENVYSSGSLIYSNDINYEYEDNFNAWKNDLDNNEFFVTVIANSYCSHCVRYQPIVHLLWNKYKFKLHFLHTDKLSTNENARLFAIDLPDYNGTPYTFIMRNGEVVDYLNGVVTKDSLEIFLKNNDIIN